MKKVIVAMDAFKGSLSSAEAAEAVEAGLRTVSPDCRVVCLPMADGGEGMVAAWSSAVEGRRVKLTACDPLMREIETDYLISPDGQTAVIELAAVSGLTLLRDEERNPMLTSTFGLGQLIHHALRHGARRLVIGIGGSATNDAGLGMLRALGYRFFNKRGEEIDTMNGGALYEVASIDATNRLPELSHASFRVACDVDNPFCGETGAAYVYARQKGADEAMIRQLDAGMWSLNRLISQTMGVDLNLLPGAGAAGGVGGALAAFLGAELTSGIYLLLDLYRFDEMMVDADLIVTGEGKADRQTLHGKVAMGLLNRAKKRRLPVALLAGSVDDEALLCRAGFAAIHAITPPDMPLFQAMNPATATENLHRSAAEIGRRFLL